LASKPPPPAAPKKNTTTVVSWPSPSWAGKRYWAARMPLVVGSTTQPAGGVKASGPLPRGAALGASCGVRVEAGAPGAPPWGAASAGDGFVESPPARSGPQAGSAAKARHRSSVVGERSMGFLAGG